MLLVQKSLEALFCVLEVLSTGSTQEMSRHDWNIVDWDVDLKASPQTNNRISITRAGLQINGSSWKLFFLFLNQNICCGYIKEPSQWDGSFEHPKHMLRWLGKKIIAFLSSKILLNWTYQEFYTDYPNFSDSLTFLWTQLVCQDMSLRRNPSDGINASLD